MLYYSGFPLDENKGGNNIGKGSYGFDKIIP